MIDGIISGEDDNEGIIEAIPKRKAEDVVQIIRSGMHNTSSASESQSNLHESPNSNRSLFADELTTLGKLKQDGIISEQEFVNLKNEILNGRK